MENYGFVELEENELLSVDGGSFWKYIADVGFIAAGVIEVYSGVGAADGTMKIIEGCIGIGTGIVGFLT